MEGNRHAVRKPERRIASSRLAHSLRSRAFQPGRFALVSFGKWQDRIQRTIPGRYPFLSLRLFNFLRHLIALFFADAGKFCAGEHQTGRSITGPSTILPFRETTPRPSERRPQRLLRRGGRDPLLSGWCVEVVQQINLTRVDQRFAVKPSCLMWAASCRNPASLLASNRRYRTPEYPQIARPAKWNTCEQQFSSFRGAFCTQVAHISSAPRAIPIKRSEA